MCLRAVSSENRGLHYLSLNTNKLSTPPVDVPTNLRMLDTLTPIGSQIQITLTSTNSQPCPLECQAISESTYFKLDKSPNPSYFTSDRLPIPSCWHSNHPPNLIYVSACKFPNPSYVKPNNVSIPPVEI